MELQRVGHDWAPFTFIVFISIYYAVWLHFLILEKWPYIGDILWGPAVHFPLVTKTIWSLGVLFLMILKSLSLVLPLPKLQRYESNCLLNVITICFYGVSNEIIIYSLNHATSALYTAGGRKGYHQLWKCKTWNSYLFHLSFYLHQVTVVRPAILLYKYFSSPSFTSTFYSLFAGPDPHFTLPRQFKVSKITSRSQVLSLLCSPFTLASESP